MPKGQLVLYFLNAVLKLQSRTMSRTSFRRIAAERKTSKLLMFKVPGQGAGGPSAVFLFSHNFWVSVKAGGNHCETPEVNFTA